jgi:hypothetical protein
MSLAVPVLSVAAVNLSRDLLTCSYYAVKGEIGPEYCRTTYNLSGTGLINHAWDVEAAKEMITGAISTGVGKGITNSIDVNTAIKVGKTYYDGGQVATQAITTLGSLKQEQNNK